MTSPTYHHGDLRRALIEAGHQLLETSPDAELSLRQLAKLAGVSPNAPYRHFKDREAFLSALAAEGFRQLAASIHEREGSLANAYAAFATGAPARYRVMFNGVAHGGRDPDLIEAIESFFAELMAGTEMREGSDDPEQSLRRAVGLWAVLHGSVMLTLDGTIDWLDDWLRPTGDELVSAMNSGLQRLSRRTLR